MERVFYDWGFRIAFSGRAPPEPNGRAGLPESSQPACRDRRRNDLPNTGNPDRPNHSTRDAMVLGNVRIRSTPTPDAQDRLRRLFALLVRYATADGTSPTRQRPHNEDGGNAEVN